MSDFENALNSILSSPQELEKIMGLAKQLSGAAGTAPDNNSTDNSSRQRGRTDPPAPAPSGPGGIDPRIMGILSRVMGEYSAPSGSSKSALLNSIKPYLRHERQRDLERAIEIARLARTAKTALNEFPGGKRDV